MNYNILAQSLLDANSHKLYSKAVRLGFAHWRYRIVNLIAELLRSQSHLLCLQEVDAPAHEEILTALERHGYHGIYKQRGGDKLDGCAIYYHRTISLVEYKGLTLEFESRPPPTSLATIACNAGLPFVFQEQRRFVRGLRSPCLSDRNGLHPLTLQPETGRHSPPTSRCHHRGNGVAPGYTSG